MWLGSHDFLFHFTMLWLIWADVYTFLAPCLSLSLALSASHFAADSLFLSCERGRRARVGKCVQVLQGVRTSIVFVRSLARSCSFAHAHKHWAHGLRPNSLVIVCATNNALCLLSCLWIMADRINWFHFSLSLSVSPVCVGLSTRCKAIVIYFANSSSSGASSSISISLLSFTFPQSNENERKVGS